MAGDSSAFRRKRKAPEFTEAQRRPGFPNPFVFNDMIPASRAQARPGYI